MNLSWITLVVFYLISTVTTDFTQRVEEKKLVDKLVSPSQYDKDVRPSGPGDGPTVVTINMFVREIYNFHPGTQTMNLQVTFRQQWLDERLKFNDTIKFLSLPGNGNQIWTPDVFFTNEREARTHELLKPNVQVRILPSGQVLYSRRITLKITCSMCLDEYPFDKQNCSMKIASYGMASSDLIFKWKDSKSVQVAQKLVLRNFKFKEVRQEECSGEFSCIRAIFHFDRILHPHFTQLFLPSILIHIVSWTPFWFAPSQGRGSRMCVMISLLSFLFLTWFCVTSESTRSPDSFEFNPKDIWVGSVLILTFLSFIHICILEIMNGNMNTDDSDNHSEKLLPRNVSGKTSMIGCAIYPLTFIGFNVVYWTYFLKDWDWD